MKTPTKQVFVHVSASYMAKNGLERVIAANLQELDNTIHDSGTLAKLRIRAIVQNSVENYPNSNRCKKPNVDLRSYTETETCRVNDLIQLSIYPVHKYESK